MKKIASELVKIAKELLATKFGYIAMYKGKKFELEAGSSYEAQKKAAEHFKVPEKKAYQITVMLAEKDGKPVTHSPSEL